MIRQDLTDQIYKTEEAKFRAVVREIKELQDQGGPVLVGTTSVEKSEMLSTMLKRKGVEHQVLNAKQHEKEATIIAQAGRLGYDCYKWPAWRRHSVCAPDGGRDNTSPRVDLNTVDAPGLEMRRWPSRDIASRARTGDLTGLHMFKRAGHEGASASTTVSRGRARP